MNKGITLYRFSFTRYKGGKSENVSGCYRSKSARSRELSRSKKAWEEGGWHISNEVLTEQVDQAS